MDGFAAVVFPLLQASGCDECHAEDRLGIAAHWYMATPAVTYHQWVNVPGFNHCGPMGEGITAPPPNQVRITPGDPDASLVIRKLTDTWEMCGPFFGHMPPSPRPRMPPDQIEVIRTWIRNGAAF